MKKHERKKELEGRDASLFMVYHTRGVDAARVRIRVRASYFRCVRGVRTKGKWKGSVACLLNED